MAIYGLWVGLSSRVTRTPRLTSLMNGLAQLTSNEYLVLAGTLHGIHAITSRLSPVGSSSGVQVIEGETFKITIFLTATGTKFVLLTSLADTSADATLQKVYEIYGDAVMKNPFHTLEMPIRSEGFDTRITALIGSGYTFTMQAQATRTELGSYYMLDSDIALTGLKTMTRGYSDEGDKILNYLENGIFDALQKEYLKSFIFAIYLYHTSPDTGITVPIMTLGEDLCQMSLDNVRDSPITEAVKRGRAPTLLDVKKSVKALLKTLIHATTQMDVLPKRRFATFKLYYTDKTPIDYEPPHFQPGDEEKDKWYFMTHDLDEVPDKWSIGRVNTGHHSVNLSVTSIATYLPSSSSLNNATFGGTQLRSAGAPVLTPAQEAGLRVAQAEQQIVDAQTRRVAWSGDEAVELDDADGEGEDDPDYMRLPDGTYKKRVASDVPGPLVPSGIRNNETGTIEPLCGPMDVEAHFAGVSEKVPTKLNELNREKMDAKSNVEQTQVVDELFTQDVPMPSPSPDNQSSTSTVIMDPIFQSSRAGSTGWSSPPLSAITSTISRYGSDTDIDMVKEMHIQSIVDDTAPLGQGRSSFDLKRAQGNCSNNRLAGEANSPDLLFRRSIKVAETFKGAFVIADFTKANGTTRDVSRRLIGRLEREGFLIQQTVTLDDLGFPQIGNTSIKGNAKAKQPKARKNMQPKTFIVNREALSGTKYTEYFNADPDVERRLLKIAEFTSRLKLTNKNTNTDTANTEPSHLPQRSLEETNKGTQTQVDTQMAPPGLGLKRSSPADDNINDGTPKPKKRKVKISVTHGLDLAE
ncbi:hypothetical protein C0995_014308 [Termitomyces sp. Mi166|nr:hypothetical protein C0995_014308 [Termitomyces sp. Mi166\